MIYCLNSSSTNDSWKLILKMIIRRKSEGIWSIALPVFHDALTWWKAFYIKKEYSFLRINRLIQINQNSSGYLFGINLRIGRIRRGGRASANRLNQMNLQDRKYISWMNLMPINDTSKINFTVKLSRLKVTIVLILYQCNSGIRLIGQFLPIPLILQTIQR